MRRYKPANTLWLPPSHIKREEEVKQAAEVAAALAQPVTYECPDCKIQFGRDPNKDYEECTLGHAGQRQCIHCPKCRKWCRPIGCGPL